MEEPLIAAQQTQEPIQAHEKIEISVETKNEIHVKIIQVGGDTLEFDLEPESTVGMLKRLLANSIEDLPVIRQRLIFCGKELDPNNTLRELQIVDGSTLHVVKRQLPSYEETQRANEFAGNNQHDQLDGRLEALRHALAENTTLSFDVRYVAALSKYVQIFALLDSLLITIFFFYGQTFLLPGVVCTFLGYLGARRLHRAQLAVFMVFLLAYIGVSIYLLTPTQQQQNKNMLMGLLLLLIEPYILRITYMLYRKIPDLSEEDRETVLIMNTNRLV